MIYECNPKHKLPWQRGRKGSLCPEQMGASPQDLLQDSVLWSDGKRYALCDGRAYCAQESGSNRWHGYPVGWVEVPEALRRKWRDEGKITKKDMRANWEKG